MRRRVVVIFLLLAVTFPTMSGCGTLMNMQVEAPWGTQSFWSNPEIPSRRVFGGVRYDAYWIGEACCDAVENSAGLEKLLYVDWAAYVLLVDMIPTLVGDVVTLPWTIAATVDRANGIPSGYSTFWLMQRDHESSAVGADSGGQPASK
jgi:uncharacterized protein YceK